MCSASVHHTHIDCVRHTCWTALLNCSLTHSSCMVHVIVLFVIFDGLKSQSHSDEVMCMQPFLALYTCIQCIHSRSTHGVMYSSSNLHIIQLFPKVVQSSFLSGGFFVSRLPFREI